MLLKNWKEGRGKIPMINSLKCKLKRKKKKKHKTITKIKYSKLPLTIKRPSHSRTILSSISYFYESQKESIELSNDSTDNS